MPTSLPTTAPFALHATLFQSTSPSKISFLPDTLLIVGSTGKIVYLLPNVHVKDIKADLSSLELDDLNVTILPYPKYFLIPGLIDTHVHAPQWDMRGVGSAGGMHILEWLDEYTFPHESRFAHPTHAQSVYARAVSSSLKQGITTACYYASLHTPATKILADICLEKGQRAFIGKVCMDDPTTNPSYYVETTEEALNGTREVIQHCKRIDPEGSLVRPIITPRFAISCTRESLAGLGEIAAENRHSYGGAGVQIQTHFCEAQQEVSATLKQYPGFNSEVDLYQHHGLFSERSVMAHCTTVTDNEIKMMKAADVGVSHCPISNCTVGGGFMAAPIRQYLDLNMKVGLGTDSGGGFSSSLLDAMRMAIVVGNAREMLTEGKDKRLGLEEVFWMGTRGGARVLGLEDVGVGGFEVGGWFDCVVVDTKPGEGEGGGEGGVMTGVEEGEEYEMVLEKFVMTGDDRNVVGVYVGGVRRK